MSLGKASSERYNFHHRRIPPAPCGFAGRTSQAYARSADGDSLMPDAANTGAPAAPAEEKPAATAVMKLIDRVDAVIDGGVIKAKWKVNVPPGLEGENDQAEYEYVAVARIPNYDLAKNNQTV